MQWPSPLVPGRLLRRYKRFLADVALQDGTTVTAHCANTGSMLGCDRPGSAVLLSEASNPARKLRYTWELVRVGPTWVGINTARANAIVAEAVTGGRIPELAGHTGLRREVPYGKNSRVDLLLAGGPGPTYVEVKNTTLADGRTARFPDAVTERGRKHMGELARMVRAGNRAAVVFLVHRDDARLFCPADDIDPAYGKALRGAAKAGVMVLPYGASAGPEGVWITGRLEADF
jgi:sugar fermentation stimulation protein A